MKKELTLPSSLHEVTLDRYIKVIALSEKKLSTDECISALFDIPLETIGRMTQASVEALAISFHNIITQEYSPMYKFVIDKVTFGMIPDFRDTNVMWHEYTDSAMHINNVLNGTMKSDSYKRFMSVLFRPIIKDENGLIELEPYESSEKYYNLMGKAPAAAFKGAEAFFLTLREDCLSYFKTSMAEGEAVELQALEKILTTTGAGTEALGTLRELAGSL